MKAAQHALDEILALEVSLQAALEAARRKLKALQAAKATAAAKTATAPPGAGDSGNGQPWNWTIFNILNGPTGEMGGAAGNNTGYAQDGTLPPSPTPGGGG